MVKIHRINKIVTLLVTLLSIATTAFAAPQIEMFKVKGGLFSNGRHF